MELSEYILQTLRKDGEFILYRGRHRRQDEGIPPSILVRTPFLERPALGSLRRMEHELSLKAEPEWAVRPLVLREHQGRAMLLLEDPGENLSICSLQGRWRGDRLRARPSAFAQHCPITRAWSHP